MKNTDKGVMSNSTSGASKLKSAALQNLEGVAGASLEEQVRQLRQALKDVLSIVEDLENYVLTQCVRQLSDGRLLLPYPHTLDVQIPSGAISLNATSISLNGGMKVSANTVQLEVNASSFNCNCPLSSFGGTVKCDTFKANSVIGSSYTPAAGNIW